MITDDQTNFLYLAESLKSKKYMYFLKRFEKVLIENAISYDFIKNTKDIWAVDFMPIQISKDIFVQFEYHPDYLFWFNLEHTKSNPRDIPEAIKYSTLNSSLKVDGGNVIKSKNKIIMCDKFLKENITYCNSQTKIIDELLKIYCVEELIIIPTHPDDFIGHADGMVRFIDDNNVVINDLSGDNFEYRNELISVLKKHKLSYFEMPYHKPETKLNWDSRGIYVNYLQMNDIIFVPQFGFKEDEKALKFLSEIFPNSKIVSVLCNEIAREGGALNCISWNIHV